MKRKYRRVSNKKGVTLVELIATIALLSILAAASVAIVGIVMQAFRTSTTMALSSQEITQAQTLLHNTAEIATSIELLDRDPEHPAQGDRKLYLSGGKICLSQWDSTEGWKDFVPFDGIKSASFGLVDNGLTMETSVSAKDKEYRFTYKFTTEKDYSYTGGVLVNNMKSGTVFHDIALNVGDMGGPGSTVQIIYFKMPVSP